MKVSKSILKESFKKEAAKRGHKVTDAQFAVFLEALKSNGAIVESKKHPYGKTKTQCEFCHKTIKDGDKTYEVPETMGVFCSEACVDDQKGWQKEMDEDTDTVKESVSKSKKNLLNERYNIGDSQKPAKAVGAYTILEKTDAGDLRIELTKRGKNYIQQESNNGRPTSFNELIGEHLKEGVWRMVNPKDIGSETTSAILSDDYSSHRGKFEYDKVYFNPITETREVDTLVKEGSLVLKGVLGE